MSQYFCGRWISRCKPAAEEGGGNRARMTRAYSRMQTDMGRKNRLERKELTLTTRFAGGGL